MPFLSNLSTEFTKYLASDLIGVTSTYAIRLYELLVQYQSIGKREISVVDLRWMFELQNKYPVWADLKRWVIDQAVKEINEFSPLSVTYETKKTGRKNHKYQSKVQAEAKTSSNCHRNAKKRSDRGNTAKTTYRASNRKIQRNFEQISSISDLSNFPDYPTFANWLGNILRDPKTVIKKRLNVFKALRTETDYGKKTTFSCGCLSPKGALYH